MSDDVVVAVWNEFVTYEAEIPRSVMEEALAAKKTPEPWQHDIIVFDAAVDKAEIVDSDGMMNITFHEAETGKEING